MARFAMIAQSSAKPGEDDVYNALHDETFFPDIMNLPGAISGRRYDASSIARGEPGLP